MPSRSRPRTTARRRDDGGAAARQARAYCQKPLTRTLAEVRAVRARPRSRWPPRWATRATPAERRRVLAANGSRPASSARCARSTLDQPAHLAAGHRAAADAPSAAPTLDWDLWLGPAPERPYNPAYAPFNWRGWWDFGTGALGDMACHWDGRRVLDPRPRVPDAHRGAECSQLFARDGATSSGWNGRVPGQGQPPAVTVVWRDGDLGPPNRDGLPITMEWPPADIGGQLWIGDGGALIAGMYGEDPVLLDPKRDAEVRANPPLVVYPRSRGCTTSGSLPARGAAALSNFDGHAGNLTEMVLLGCLAIRAGQTLQLDPATGNVTNMTLPERWITPEYRKGWTL